MHYLRRASILTILLTTAIGCGGKPDAANVTLRKKNQELSQKLKQLETAHHADQVTIRALEQTRGITPAIPATQSAQLFTVHGIKLERLTGSSDWDPNTEGDDGLKVYVVPLDETGDELKAVGSIVVEAFDLKRPEQQRIGRWEFTPAQLRELWYGQVMQYQYILQCPWQIVPTNQDLTVKVTFTDLLTGRSFEEQKVIRTRAMPSTQRAQ